MIQLTRLNRSAFLLNPDMIQTIEANPDTVITLANDEKLVVAEKIDDVVDRIVAYRRRVFSALLTGGAAEVKGVVVPDSNETNNA